MQYDEQDIAQMVSRFLAWPLPADFAPDGGITAARPGYAPEVEWRPVGTNLFTAAQAAAMIRHILATPPASDAAVPAGFVMVPVEPTPEMLSASYNALSPKMSVSIRSLREGWPHMLAAAPKVASDTDAAASEAGEVERLREAGQMAAFRAMYGDGADPFQNPESFDFCAKVADAVVAALTTQGGAEG